MKLWAWDLETYDWEHPICCVAVSEDGDVVRFWGSDCLERMCRHMLKVKGCFVAHYGGGFDVPLMLNVHKFRRIILSGSNILCAEESRDLKLRDTYPWFLNSLKKIGEAIGLHKGDTDRGNLGAHTKQEILDYCEQDCRVLLKAVQVAHSFIDERKAQRAWTSGSTAVNLLRALEPGTWKALEAHRVQVDELRVALKLVRGGRVECPARGRVPVVYSYDFKSSYPARYATRPLGIGLRKATKRDQVGVWDCQWTWPHRDRMPPALDAVTMAGYGQCRATLVNEEIELFERCGVKVQRFEGFAPETILDVGHTFLADLFAAKESGGPASAFAKVWVNSLHGKFCEDPRKECFTSWRPTKYLESEGIRQAGSWFRYYEMSCGADGICAPHCQPMAGASILGRARAALWEIIYALQSAGWEIYYCDTDSVHTNCPPEKMPIILGKTLGALALEAGPCEGFYLGPKSYLLTDATGTIVKSALKGVPLRSYERGVSETRQVKTRKGTTETISVVREAQRARPALELTSGVVLESRETEASTDLRRSVFERAMAGGAHCEKDGITSFLRGLAGIGDDAEKWKRAPTIRIIRPSGKGKAFGPISTSWVYLSTLEMVARDALLALPSTRNTWERVPEYARRWIVREGYAEESRKSFLLTAKGERWLETIGDPDPPETEESDDDTIHEN